jgi:hypothetical protein
VTELSFEAQIQIRRQSMIQILYELYCM